MASSSAESQSQSSAGKRKHPDSTPSSSPANNSLSLPNSSNVNLSDLIRSDAVPRSLDSLDFAAARSSEIKFLLSQFSHSTNTTSHATIFTSGSSSGGRRVFQTLPRHMRRRAMSHTVHRLPRRFRAAASREMQTMEKAAKSNKPAQAKTAHRTRMARKSRRTTSRLLCSHLALSPSSSSSSSAPVRWFESHLWLAKRMHMETMWGYRIPIRPTEKSFRAAYKANLHLASLFDASFIQPVEVRGDLAELENFLRPYLSAGDWEKMVSPIYFTGSREGDIFLHQANSFPFGAVGPASFMWRPRGHEKFDFFSSLPNKNEKKKIEATQNKSTEILSDPNNRTLWIWLHASIFQECLLEFSRSSKRRLTSAGHPRVRVRSLAFALNRFEIRGFRAQSVLQLVIRAFQNPDFPNNHSIPAIGNSIWQQFADEAFRTPAALPTRAILSLQCKHPDLLMKNGRIRQPFTVAGKETFQSAEQIIHSAMQTQSQTQNQTNDKSIQQLISNWPSDCSHSPLWDSIIRSEYFSSTSLGRRQMIFSRREKNRKRDERKLKSKIIKNSLSNEEGKMEIDESKSNNSIQNNNKSRARKYSTKESKKNKTNKTATANNNNQSNKSAKSSDSEMKVDSADSKERVSYTNDPAFSPWILLIQQHATARSDNAASLSSSTRRSAESARGLGSGWDLIVPAGFGMSFWRALTFAGCRAIGLADRRHFNTEIGLKSFPEDYPDCQSGLIHEYWAGRTNRAAFLRRPVKVRANFAKIAVDSPFQPDWWKLLAIQKPPKMKFNRLTLKLLHRHDGKAKFEEFIPTNHQWGGEKANIDDDDSNSELGISIVSQPNLTNSTLKSVKIPFYVDRKFNRFDLKQFQMNSTNNNNNTNNENNCRLFSVSVEFLSRGSPEEFSGLYVPTSDDIQRIDNSHRVRAQNKPKNSQNRLEMPWMQKKFGILSVTGLSTRAEWGIAMQIEENRNSDPVKVLEPVRRRLPKELQKSKLRANKSAATAATAKAAKSKENEEKKTESTKPAIEKGGDSDLIDDAEELPDSFPQPIRELIGFLSVGINSFLYSSMGFGIGAISLIGLQSLIKQFETAEQLEIAAFQGFYVLVRNRNSGIYRPAIIKLM